jgi:hypothetical protein
MDFVLQRPTGLALFESVIVEKGRILRIPPTVNIDRRNHFGKRSQGTSKGTQIPGNGAGPNRLREQSVEIPNRSDRFTQSRANTILGDQQSHRVEPTLDLAYR